MERCLSELFTYESWYFFGTFPGTFTPPSQTKTMMLNLNRHFLNTIHRRHVLLKCMFLVSAILAGCNHVVEDDSTYVKQNYNYSVGEEFETLKPFFVVKTGLNKYYLEKLDIMGLTPESFEDESVRKKYRLVKLIHPGERIILLSRVRRSLSGTQETWELVEHNLKVGAYLRVAIPPYTYEVVNYEYDRTAIRKVAPE